MKILIYGSTPLTKATCDLLKDHYELVGYIPSKNPYIYEKVDLPIVDESVEHDIKLSLQYDSRIDNFENAYNVHTGLLPEWGGVDILYHTIKEGATQQGMTFHKMTGKFDFGGIISQFTYPVFEDDTIVDLYYRMYKAYPSFVLGSLNMIELINLEELPKQKPRLFKRGEVKDKDLYRETLTKLRSKYEANIGTDTTL